MVRRTTLGCLIVPFLEILVKNYGWLAVLFSILVAGGASADCPDTAPYKKSRDVIGDLERITTASGTQESYTVNAGGIDQWLNVRGEDKANPIIVFVHGGPASPLTPAIWQFQRPIEEYFTVVNYDQRGAGKTYKEADPETVKGSLHIARYVDDAIEIAEYVRHKYHKEKLILMAHSWGTVIGFMAAQKRPDLFYAYIGIGQVINTRDNERVSFDYGLDQAKKHNNAEAVRELESIAPYPGDQPITRERIVTARKWAQFYGGLTADRDSSKYFFDAGLLSPDYEPVVMFMGRHDYTTPTEQTAAWLARIKAPAKQAVWFEHSAHMIPWEEPGKMLVSLLKYVRDYAPGNREAKTH